MAIDPRLAQRRRSVAEQRIRSNLRRLVGVIALVGVLAAGVWVLRSPLFAVSSIDVNGVVASDALETLVEAGAIEGVPLISIDTAQLEEAIELDPRVVAASVTRDWPQSLIVTVEERFPIAWVASPAGTVHVAADGVIIEAGSRPTEAPVVRTFAQGSVEPGERLDDPALVGALEFLDTLRDDLLPNAMVDATRQELTATVAGYTVRLGLPADMASKAAVLAAVVDSEPEPGSEITLFAPERPAVLEPSANTTTTTLSDQDGEGDE
jgi:cell division protein FtsQ